jgi:hypothetical protein
MTGTPRPQGRHDTDDKKTQVLNEEISREIARLAVAAGRKAVAGEPVEQDWARIESLQKIKAALPPPANRLFAAAVVVGAISLAVASMAWTMRVWTTRVQLTVVTSTVHLRLAEDLDWTGNWRLQPANVRLEHFSHFDLPNQYERLPAFSPGSSLDLMVSSGEVRLTHLLVGSGALMTLASDAAGAVDIVVRGAAFRGDIDITGDVLIQAHPPPKVAPPAITFVKSEPPGRLGFQFSGKTPDGTTITAVPAVLHDQPIDPPAFQEIPISNIGFSEERSNDTRPMFASQIVSGTLTLADTGEHIELNQGAALRLAAAEGLVSSLNITDAGVKLVFEGTCHGISLGSGAFERDLTPTWLEWLFHQQKLGFLWTAITFLSGLFWSVRKLLQG